MWRLHSMVVVMTTHSRCFRFTDLWLGVHTGTGQRMHVDVLGRRVVELIVVLCDGFVPTVLGTCPCT